MATTSNVVSFAAFEQLPDADGFHRELIEGELQILPQAKLRHSLVARGAFKLLLAIEVRADGRALMEAGYKLGNDPSTWIQPDVSFLRSERVRATADSGYCVGAPELAIEVVSPSESAADLKRKVSLLLKAGSLAVWVIYPEERIVHVYRPDGTSYAADTLTAPELLAGWEAPVATLFED